MNTKRGMHSFSTEKLSLRHARTRLVPRLSDHRGACSVGSGPDRDACATGTCAGYVGSMGATLYAALVMHSYIMSLICCAVQARLLMRCLCHWAGLRT